MITKDIFIKNKGKVHINTSESLRLGILLAIVGGFLDGYTFICRGGVFANAQTGNIVLVGIDAAKGNFIQALMALLPVLAFIVGIIVTEKIKDFQFPSSALVTYSEQIIIIIEIVVLFIVGFIPNSMPHPFATLPISFVSSVQIASFSKLVDSPYSTAMCTGNLRSASQAAYKAFVKKDTNSALRAKRYITIIFSFIAGACFSRFMSMLFGIKSIWFASLVLVISLILFRIDDYRFNSSNNK